MAISRDNCIILLIEEPVPGRLAAELTGAFGAERAVHIDLDLLQNAYKLAKNFQDAILILSYNKSPRHPDLTWLDHDDPGFLEAKGKALENRIADAFQLSFNTGAKKALILNHLSPGIKPEWLTQAFDAINEKTIALGLNQNGSIYLAGASFSNLKALEGLRFSPGKTAEELSEKARKNKLSVFQLPEAYAVENEETLRKWLDARETSPSLL
jgi:glycosyltransferase A (GT-A) superfamily protein (DUF2064 family)